MPLFALLRPRCAGHLSHRERQGCRDGNRFTTIRLSGGTRIEVAVNSEWSVSIQIRSISCANIRCLGSPFGRAVTAGDWEGLAPAGRHLPAKVPAFSDWTLPLFALSVLAALGHLSHRGGRGAGTETVLRPSDFRAARALRGSRKTVNGAYRYRYAPFLVPIYDALALPLGELSPQVTERALRPRDVICLRRCQHFPIGRCRYLPLRPRCARPPLPQGEARGAGTETVLRPSDFRAARALRGSRKQ